MRQVKSSTKSSSLTDQQTGPTPTSSSHEPRSRHSGALIVAAVVSLPGASAHSLLVLPAGT